MIWFWLCLFSGVILGLFRLGGLFVERWWQRRKARKVAEAQLAAMVNELTRAFQPVGEALLGVFRRMTPALNEAAKAMGPLAEAFRGLDGNIDHESPTASAPPTGGHA